MENELFKLIKKCKIFTGVSDAALQELLPQFEQIELQPNEILFHQGDEQADSLFVVVSGRLLASLTTIKGVEKEVGIIESGETVGELGALSIQPRTLTVKALTHTTLLKLSQQNFKNFCKKHPTGIFEVIDSLIARSQRTLRLLSEENIFSHVAIIPANTSVRLDKFKEQLIPYLKEFPEILWLDESATEEKIKNAIEAGNKLKNIVLYFIENKGALFSMAHKYFEKIYIVGNGNTTANFDVLVQEILSRKAFKIHCELILLYLKTDQQPKNTDEWLKKINFSLHHHIRLYQEQDFKRLCRFILGKAVGLVLGGGGARGWAEVGALKAILENNIPIDFIGGTSAGAGAGASFIVTGSYERTYDLAWNFAKSIRHPFLDFTWPAISLLSTKHGTERLQKTFANIYMEDLWIPFFCISSNLTEGKEIVHRQGLLWQAIRASLAVPGIMPPMVLNGQLHYDGGLFNNLPVDVMRNLLGKSGIIIAINISNITESHQYYNFPPALSFFKTMLAKLRIMYRDYKFPNFFNTFLNSLLVGSLNKARTNSLLADLFINPYLENLSMFALKKKNIKRLHEIGYQTTKDLLKDWKHNIKK